MTNPQPIRDRFAAPEYCNPNAKLPYIQSLRGENPAECGFFLSLDDRALQALVKLALEPEWEARFEPNSYGFRSGRSAHDAIEAIFNGIRYRSKYVLDADIAKCFDRIDHKYLIKKLGTFPTLARLIKSWLKAGWVFQGCRYSLSL